MRKKLAFLLAGAVSLSLLLSACGTGAAPSPDIQDVTASPQAGPSAKAAAPSEEPDIPNGPSASPEAVSSQDAAPSQEEPSEEPSAPADTAPAASVPPAQVGTPRPQPTKAPAVNTPRPVVSSPAPAVSAAAEPPAASAAPEPAPEPIPEPTPQPTPTPAASPRDVAVSYIGRSASGLIAAIGQPLARDYAPSCLGSGEGGELIYNGFTVYTYREGTTETVTDVF